MTPLVAAEDWDHEPIEGWDETGEVDLPSFVRLRPHRARAQNGSSQPVGALNGRKRPHPVPKRRRTR